ncbi:hypothetical protein B7494_g2078 [Chlorociboria aeruginascens]|nr:hypothetical protein B7494_g2078 [Chlorociboria aeruginascens]
MVGLILFHILLEEKYLTKNTQPAKRRIPATAAEASAAPKMRQSKLAKEHNITGAEESEIKEAWSMFSKPMQGEKEGIIEIGITPTPAELKEFNSILDPEDEGFAIYPSFVAICALKMHSRSRTSEAHNEEVEEAFNMFARLGKGDRNGEERITMRTFAENCKGT